jgi:hypothetical protein
MKKQLTKKEIEDKIKEITFEKIFLTRKQIRLLENINYYYNLLDEITYDYDMLDNEQHTLDAILEQNKIIEDNMFEYQVNKIRFKDYDNEINKLRNLIK